MSDFENFKISPMIKQDTYSVAEIEKECFSEPWSQTALENELSNESAMFFVAKNSDGVFGYIGMHTVLDECYIANIAVGEKYRRRKVAEKLLIYSIEKVRERNCSFISLEVRVSNAPAIALYEKMGFVALGERKDFYSKPKENALIMTKYLDGDENI